MLDNTLDVSSTFAAFTFGYAGSEEEMIASLQAVENVLLNQSPSGGSPRYENDGYFRSNPAHKGNPWAVTTLWIAQIYLMIERKEDAKVLIDWTIAHALPSGAISEQVTPEDGNVVGVTPLVWSHAELINALLLLHEQ